MCICVTIKSFPYFSLNGVIFSCSYMVDVGTEKPPKSPEWISGAEKRKRNGAPCRRRDLRRGRRFWCCISLRPFRRTDPGLAFMAKFTPNLPDFANFGNATKDRSIYQNRIDKALREWYCNHILRGGCGQDDEILRSYCRSGCQGRRRILLRRKRSLYDRHYYGRHYGVHFVAIISIIGTIPYGWRGVQNG